MTIQVKDAIRKLKEIGFKRNDFSVNAERHSRRDSTGFRWTEWGDARICVYLAYPKWQDKADAILAAGFSLHVWEFDGVQKMAMIRTDYSERGKLFVHRVNTTTKEVS